MAARHHLARLLRADAEHIPHRRRATVEPPVIHKQVHNLSDIPEYLEHQELIAIATDLRASSCRSSPSRSADLASPTFGYFHCVVGSLPIASACAAYELDHCEEAGQIRAFRAIKCVRNVAFHFPSDRLPRRSVIGSKHSSTQMLVRQSEPSLPRDTDCIVRPRKAPS